MFEEFYLHVENTPVSITLQIIEMTPSPFNVACS